jgi:hypothetical protein
MKRVNARVELFSTTPYAQSRNHNLRHLDGESEEEYEERTWQHRMHVRNYTDETGQRYKAVVIPASNLLYSLKNAARLLDPPVNVTGIKVVSDLDLGISPDQCRKESVNAHLDGSRGSADRIIRHFPTFDEWDGVVNLVIVDENITESLLRELFEVAGQLVGVGQFRPQNRGTNGCWQVRSVEWEEVRPVSSETNAVVR